MVTALDTATEASPDGALRVDVTVHVAAKLAALAAHRTQYPIDVDLFPRAMLEEMFGIEYFVVHRRAVPNPSE
jgi:LmbE family N-acetylglucosaminyl deacetylase